MALGLILVAQQRAFPGLTAAEEQRRSAAPATRQHAHGDAPAPAGDDSKRSKPPLSLLAALPTEIAPRTVAALDSRSLRDLLERRDGAAGRDGKPASHGVAGGWPLIAVLAATSPQPAGRLLRVRSAAARAARWRDAALSPIHPNAPPRA